MYELSSQITEAIDEIAKAKQDKLDGADWYPYDSFGNAQFFFGLLADMKMVSRLWAKDGLTSSSWPEFFITWRILYGFCATRGSAQDNVS
jgi:hypothetical protein